MAYKKELNRKVNLFVERLAEHGAEIAWKRFSEASYDGDKDVTVTVENDGNTARVVASGETVAFIEFGTGTSFPDHPSGLFEHGTYGKGQGSNPKGWVYVGEAGTGGQWLREGVYRTKGNPPAMAMWTATTDMAAAISEIWREVMASD